MSDDEGVRSRLIKSKFTDATGVDFDVTPKKFSAPGKGNKCLDVGHSLLARRGISGNILTIPLST